MNESLRLGLLSNSIEQQVKEPFMTEDRLVTAIANATGGTVEIILRIHLF